MTMWGVRLLFAAILLGTAGMTVGMLRASWNERDHVVLFLGVVMAIITAAIVAINLDVWGVR